VPISHRPWASHWRIRQWRSVFLPGYDVIGGQRVICDPDHGAWRVVRASRAPPGPLIAIKAGRGLRGSHRAGDCLNWSRTMPTSTQNVLPTRYRPTGSVFAPIQREFDRLFDQLGSGWPGFADGGMVPKMDVRDTADAVEVTVELPGIDKDDVKISIDGDVLTISGEKKTESERKQEDYRVSERTYGAFSRSISLPHSVAPEKITAMMDKGVLKLTAPHNGAAAAKQIPIQTAS
jgi:HSP20 family protein